MNRQDGTASAKVIRVIETTAKRGSGTEKDPVRMVTQYWDLEGKLLAESDMEHDAVLLKHEEKILQELKALLS